MKICKKECCEDFCIERDIDTCQLIPENRKEWKELQKTLGANKK